jgi:glycosyltransferase involved in cell wall biosynthesis
VLSVVVVAHDMARELPRTLHSLSPAYQAGIAGDDYEVIVVDNGSSTPVAGSLLEPFQGRATLERLHPAPGSPARAANRGLALAAGDLIGLVIDGARLASPGLLAAACRARRLADRPVISAPGFHLGPVRHMRAAEANYDQAVEDALLERSGWKDDGYRLFGISTLGGSSGRGLFGPMGESSSLFATRDVWHDLGGLDERFTLPGGGLVNHDLYRRACSLDGTELVVLFGEATFHQYHGGAATSRRYTWDEMHAQYETLRGEAYQPPPRQPLYFGAIAPAVLPVVERSARQAIDRLAQASRDDRTPI